MSRDGNYGPQCLNDPAEKTGGCLRDDTNSVEESLTRDVLRWIWKEGKNLVKSRPIENKDSRNTRGVSSSNNSNERNDDSAVKIDE